MRSKRSALLRSCDILPLMRALVDAAALRHQPSQQHQFLIDRLSGLLGTQLGVWIEIDEWRPGRQSRPTVQVLTSNPDPYWVAYMRDFTIHHSPYDDPYADHSIHCKAPRQIWQLQHLVADRANRRRYASTLDLAKKLKVGDGVVSVIRTGEAGDTVVGFSLQRRVEFGKLSAREMAVARLAIAEIGDMMRRGSLCTQLKRHPGLPPRLRQVLERTLNGQSPVSMARAMGLSLHTVREHINRLYRHFGVNTREELMARFIR